MSEQSLWHRLNPFHNRPPSVLKRYNTPVDSSDRGSSIDTHVPHTSEDCDQERQYRVSTPGADTTATKPRTPSILRSLAHHPSLGGLKNKTKSKRSSRRLRDPIPPLPTLANGGGFHPEHRRRTLSKTVKESQSVPRDLRLSSSRIGESSADDSSVTDHFAAPPRPFEAARKVRPKRASTRDSPISIRRKPVPSPTPDLLVSGPDTTPESVRTRRQRFQFDFTAEPTPVRRRAASTGELLEGSPPRAAEAATRLSNPPPPSPYRAQYASSKHPFTTQHPHPVPLTLSPQSYYDENTDMYGDYDPSPDDFVPLTESGRTHRLSDGFDILVGQEELPVGTPGGKKADLRLGALIDGAKPTKDAVRFFSRDTYGVLDHSHSSTPSLAPPTKGSTTDDRCRSASPFEVMLSPMVTKRMSLDAFGTPTPTASHESPSKAPGIEVLREEDEASDQGDDEDYDDEDVQELGQVITDFHPTSLSTIREQSNSRHDPLSSEKSEKTVRITRSFDNLVWTSTPVRLWENGLPLAPTDSSYGSHPQRPRQHFSAPPMAISPALLEAHGKHARALQDELVAARNVIEALEGECGTLRSKVEELYLERQDYHNFESKVRELEELLREKDEEYEEVHAQIRVEAEAQDIPINKLRQTLETEEGFLENLPGHDELDHKMAKLEADYAELLRDRARDGEALAASQKDSQKEIFDLKAKATLHAQQRDQAQEAIVELQRQLHDTEKELEHIKTSRSDDTSGIETEVIVLNLEDKLAKSEARVAELEDLLKEGISRVMEFERLKSQLSAKDERIIDLQNRQTERQRDLDGSKDEVAERDLAIASLKEKNDALEKETAANDRDLKAALRSATAKDSIIGVLRDKLRTADFAMDELKSKVQADVSCLENQVKEWRSKHDQVEAELEGVRTGKEMVEMLLERAREELEVATQEGEEGREYTETLRESIRQLEAEKEGLNEERAELFDKLHSLDGEGETVTLLQSQLQSANDELADVRQGLEETQAELELAHRHLELTRDELDEAHETLETRTTTLQLQDDELDYLRKALVEAEEAAEALGDGFLRRAKEAERELATSHSELAELSSSLSKSEKAIQNAVLTAEMEKANALDAKSRLAAYLAEVDRLSLANATLKKELEDTHRDSAKSELKLVEMERKVQKLEEDKELLNVAVESKQTELVLLQRQLGQGTPRNSGAVRVAPATSAGRIVRSNGLDVTPIPSRRMSTSNALGKDSVPPPPALAVPKSKIPSTPTPLGATGRHNRQTPEHKVSSAKKVGISQGLSRKSSLPVLKRPTGDIGMAVGASGVTKVDEEDEM